MDSAAICGAVESLRQEVESTGWLLDKVHWRQGWRRRNVLLLTVAGFLVFNSITAFSSNYWLTLAARFFASVSAGLAWSLLAGYARRMVPVHRQGKALAVAMVGTPIALSLGVPLVVGQQSAPAVATEGCADQRDHDFVIVSRQRGELTFGAAEGPTIESRFD